MRTIARIFAVFLTVAVIGGVVVIVRSGGLRGAADDSRQKVEAWVGDQITQIANYYLNPSLEFERFRYEYPITAIFDGVRLEAEGVSILSADRMRIEFAEIPRKGKAVVIQSIELDRPEVNLIRTADEEILGFDNLVKNWSGDVALKDAESAQLSDVFAIRTLGIAGGAVRFQPHDGAAMVLDGLDGQLDATPIPGQPGWYSLGLDIDRPGLNIVKATGRFNINDLMLEIASGHLTVAVEESRYELFPSAVQTWLRTHEVTCDATLEWSGAVDLQDINNASLDFDLNVTDAHYMTGKYALQIDSIKSRSAIREQRWNIHDVSIVCLGGTGEISGQVDLAGPAFSLDCEVDGMSLEQALRADPPKYKGRVDGTMHIGQKADDILDGAGQFTIADADLSGTDMVRTLAKALTLRLTGKPDRGRCDFTVHPEFVRLTGFEVVGHGNAMRGSGTLGYDGELDLVVNAGPLEKMQAELGLIGSVLGFVSDRLVAYRITGRVGNLKIAVKPLRLGADPSR